MKLISKIKMKMAKQLKFTEKNFHVNDLDEDMPAEVLTTTFVQVTEPAILEAVKKYRVEFCGPFEADGLGIEWNGYNGCAYDTLNGFEIWIKEEEAGEEYELLPALFVTTEEGEFYWPLA